jgi:6-phosphogluconate dehydrogenase
MVLPHKHIGVVGLGKMGANIARNALKSGWEVTAWNRTRTVTEGLVAEGVQGAYSFEELAKALPKPRIIWMMLPAGQAVDDAIFGISDTKGIADFLEAGDIVVDAGNSNFKDAAPRHEKLAKKKIQFMDIGVSGGPAGALNKACLMIGGDTETFQTVEPLCKDLSRDNSYQHFPGIGAGHFVKMVHNGIEYGMMQALAEGMAVLKASPYKLNLSDVVSIYNNGSVIESRLVGWLQSGYKEYGEELVSISSVVAHTGEGAWTITAAKELNVPVPVIEDSLEFRKQSATKGGYIGKVLSTLRNQFGGHAAADK